MRSFSLGLVTSVLLGIAISKYFKKSSLDAVPAVGSTGFFSSYWTAIKFNLRTRDMLEEGYTKYKGRAFKIASLYGWNVVVSGSRLIEDIKKAPDDVLLTIQEMNSVVKVDHTTMYHITHLTQDLAAQFTYIRDEIMVSFNDHLQIKGNEWVSVPAMDTILQVMCRTNNRALVGLPLCRDPEWIALNLQFADDVMKDVIATQLLPKFIASIVSRFLTEPNSMKRGIKLLQPIVEGRQKYLDEHGSNSDWANKSNDMLSWIMEEAKGEERTVRKIAIHIMTLNFDANSDSSMVFTHVLFYLATYPQYADQLREEVEVIIEEHGWSKAALAKMHKVDSFLKETMRLETSNLLSMNRIVAKEFTFSDGTVVPPGGFISVASYATHLDGEIYDNPSTFDPLRFTAKHEDGVKVRDQLASMSSEYLPFGLGKHACPGRFIALNVMKIILAHIVMTYDVKLEEEGVRPPNETFGVMSFPNSTAKVMFRKRLEVRS